LNIFIALLLGLIQGIAEFLPISSSGHLVLFSNLFGLESAGESNLFFDVLLHFGTLIAVFVYYRKDIAEMISEFFGWIGDLFKGAGKRDRRPVEVPPARRLIFLIIVATLPLFLVLPIKDLLEGIRTRPALVGVALIVTGLVLFLSDRIAKGRKTERSATWLDALFVGVCQAIAVTPGISRSGSTISAGLFCGFERKFAVRFSFLMSLPAVLAATAVTFLDALKAGIDTSLVPIYLAGMAVAGVSGYFAIKLINYIAEKSRFGFFAYYCWAAGVISIIAALLA
jgi:undecaprenyl-diphosphatase